MRLNYRRNGWLEYQRDNKSTIFLIAMKKERNDCAKKILEALC